jgi:hypothetical protein
VRQPSDLGITEKDNLLSLEIKKEKDKQSAFIPQNNGAKISRKNDRERYRDIVLELKK